MTYRTEFPQHAVPWNKGRLVEQKPPLKIRETWAIRLQLANKVRELARLIWPWTVNCATVTWSSSGYEISLTAPRYPNEP